MVDNSRFLENVVKKKLFNLLIYESNNSYNYCPNAHMYSDYHNITLNQQISQTHHREQSIVIDISLHLNGIKIPYEISSKAHASLNAQLY